MSGTNGGGGPLQVIDDGNVRWLVLDRPDKRNALDRTLATELLRALLDASQEPSVRAIVVTGEGGAFCAGDDISQLRAMLDGDSSQNAQCHESGDALYLRIAEAMTLAPKPVIAAIDGACAGAGTEMACAADLRIASDRARIGSGLVAIGQAGNGVMLPRVVGPSRATEIYLRGRLLDADEALAIGLVSEVVPAAGFRERVNAIVEPLADGPTAVIGLFKELRDRAWGTPVEHGLRLEEATHRRCMLTADAAEGAVAYLERRPSTFTGR